MPQFCLLFYAILQSWRWHNAPPKYAPVCEASTVSGRQVAARLEDRKVSFTVSCAGQDNMVEYKRKL